MSLYGRGRKLNFILVYFLQVVYVHDIISSWWYHLWAICFKNNTTDWQKCHPSISLSWYICDCVCVFTERFELPAVKQMYGYNTYLPIAPIFSSVAHWWLCETLMTCNYYTQQTRETSLLQDQYSFWCFLTGCSHFSSFFHLHVT